jgi:hypothetical protein
MRITMRTTGLLAACILAGIGNGWAMGQDRPPVLSPPGARPAPAVAVAPSDGDATPTPIPGLTDKLGLDPKKPSALLGDAFESPVAGISFRPPAGSKAVKQTDQDHVVDYVDEDRHWILKVTRARLAQAMPLQSAKVKGADRVGLLDYTVQDVLKEHPAAEVLRQEIINIGEHGVGMSALRFNIGSQRYLRQQALFQVDEQLYYVFNLTTPAAKEGRPEDNDNERQAAETFRAMIETIQLVDRGWIKTDQVNRLFRTRALFTDWQDKGGRRIKNAVIPETWLRIMRDGKDIGYSYVAEQFVEGKDVKSNPGRAYDGVLINVRSRTMEKGNQVDVGSQMFASLDRKHEDWTNVVNEVNNKGQKNEDKRQNSEYGFSELRMTRIVDRDAARDPKDPHAPPGRDVEAYKLSVTRPNRDKDTMAKPEYFTPSPWYIPEAVGAMLPRLLPLNRPVTYLFQSYIGEQREVMHRYVDVGFEKTVQLGGQTVQAIPISDRIRLEGSPTVHYMSPEGKYLGSVNEEAKLTILPTDKATLEKIWKVVEMKNEEVAPAPGSEAK